MRQNRNRPETYDGQTVRRVINFQLAYEAGLKEVAQQQARDAANSKRLAEILDAAVLSGKDAGRFIVFRVRLNNKTVKTLEHADLRLNIFDAATKKALASMELNIDRRVPAHRASTFDMPVHYALFGSSTSAMMMAAKRPKIFIVHPDRVEIHRRFRSRNRERIKNNGDGRSRPRCFCLQLGPR